MAQIETLSISDLSLGHTVCEVRYEMAFLIFDRTGAICIDCKEKYPELRLIQASPSSTSFSVGDYSCWLEQTMARTVLAVARLDPKEFGLKSKPFFEIVLRHLEVSILTRLGLRQVYYRTFKDPDGASEAIRSLKLEDGPADESFGMKGQRNELVLRWESDQQGLMLHVVAIPGNAVLPVFDIRGIERGFGERYKSALVFDVDFYTTAPVLRSQWDSEEWIVQSSHAVKKGLKRFLG